MSYLPYANAREYVEAHPEIYGDVRAFYERLRDEHYNGPNANGQKPKQEEDAAERATANPTAPFAPTSTEWSHRCLRTLIATADWWHGTNKIDDFVDPHDAASISDIAAALERANIPKQWRDPDGNEVDLSNPAAVINYVEDNLDSFIAHFDETSRARLLQTRAKYYQNSRHEDGRRMAQLKDFYRVVDKSRVDTVEDDIRDLQRQLGESFSWDHIYSVCERTHGMNPSDTSSWSRMKDQQTESQRDADEMDKITAIMALSAQIDPMHPAYGSRSSYRALEAIERLSEDILSGRQNERKAAPVTEPPKAKKSTKSKSQRKNARRRQKQKEATEQRGALRNISDISNQTGVGVGKPEKAPDSNAATKGKGQQPEPQLTLSMLASETPEVQKNMIGGRLYPLIHKTHPKIAGKITDRLLELDSSSLLDLLESPEALEAKISEVDGYSSGYWRHFVRTLKPVEKRRSYVSVVVP